MSATIIENQPPLPVSFACDVAVVGGGIAGVAAALASARQGQKSRLIEKQCVWGGRATSGLIAIYLPLCDGLGTQVSFGLAEELFRLSIKRNWQDKYPAPWLDGGTREERAKKRFEVQFNPIYYALDLEAALLESGVTIWYDTRVCHALLSDGRVTALCVENEDGRTAVEASAFVDASGEARLFQLSGAPTCLHAIGNKVAGWYYSSGPKDGHRLHMLGFADAPPDSTRDTDVAPADSTRYSGVTADSINRYLLASHRFTLKDSVERLARTGDEPSNMAHMPQFRMTRRIAGACAMTEADDRRACDESVGMVSDWRKAGPRFEVPYGCLYTPDIDNLYAAGRCVSCDDGMWDVLRVIPDCAVTGEAAGIAAALTPKTGRAPLGALQAALKAQGQKLHFTELDH